MVHYAEPTRQCGNSGDRHLLPQMFLRS